MKAAKTHVSEVSKHGASIMDGTDGDLITRLISSVKSVSLWHEAYPEPRVAYLQDVQQLLSELQRRFLIANPTLFRMLRSAARKFNRACPDVLAFRLEQVTRPSELKALRSCGYKIGKSTRLSSPLLGDDVVDAFKEIFDEHLVIAGSSGHLNRDPLTDRQLEILVAMKVLKAVEQDRRASAKRICEKASGAKCISGDFKKAMRRLQKRGLIETSQRGCAGGSWLTDEGKKAIEDRNVVIGA